ncbi:winged helix-turn-helix transcriptional regulator [Candidatus Gottesmanbacteria bacterium]|nr:winged helix-turn-helix transcriptional regulator [Candidatus Gottesmanbacteria bacterium]
MNKQIIASQLSSFGLDEVETRIYLYLLENGSRTPLNLSRDTNINRSRIYRYLDKLKSKKLIEEVNIGRGITLKASNPDNLELLILEKEQELKTQKENLPDILKGLTTLGSDPNKGIEIKHYHGTDGLKQMLWNHLSAKKEILVFGFENRNNIAGKAFAEKIRYEQVKRKITKIEVENATDQGDYWYTNVPDWGKYYKSRYIPPKILDIRQYQVIFNDTISILNWADGNKVGVEIANSPFVGMYKQIFWRFWDIAEDYIEEGKRVEKAKNPKNRHI